MTVRPVGSTLDTHASRWTPLLRVNVPRRHGRPNFEAERRAADAMKRWALDVYGSEA